MSYYQDGGYRSRKMVMAYAVILLIAGGFLLTGLWPALAVTYGEFIMAVLAAASIYSGSNAGVKWMALKSGAGTEAEEKPMKPKASAPKLPPAPKPPDDVP